MLRARNPGRLPLVLAVLLVVTILVVPLLRLPDPLLTTSQIFSAPSTRHPLGTDQFGRDNFSRSLWALRDGVLVTSLAAGIAGLLGVLLGVLALLSQWSDRIVIVLLNVALSIPGLLLSLVLLTFFRPSLANVALAVGLSLAPVFARVVRGALLSVSSHDFVEASVALGAGRIRIVIMHLLPNVASELLSFLAVILSWAAINVTALDFLGLAGSPSTPSLGNLLVDGRTYLRASPWIALGPGMALTSITLVAFSLSNSRRS